MMADLRRFAINQITTRDWTLEQAVNGYARQGVAGIGVWMEYLDACGVRQGARLIRDAGLFVPSLCTSAWVNIADRAGFDAAVAENRRRLDAAAEIGATALVVVPGSLATGERICPRRGRGSLVRSNSSYPMRWRSVWFWASSPCTRCMPQTAPV